MIVGLSFDDNDSIDGMNWIINLFNRYNSKCTFFNSSKYIHYMNLTYKNAYDNGFEIGCHTHNHLNGSSFSIEKWKKEIQTCIDKHKEIGIDCNKIFRAPYLEVNDNMFVALNGLGFKYDSSLEYYPYDYNSNEIPYHYKGIIEIPIQSLENPGLKSKSKNDYITGMDWNWLFEEKFTSKNALELLKYNFDIKYEQNIPFFCGFHSGIYGDDYEHEHELPMRLEARRKVLSDFLEYITSKPRVFIQNLTDFNKN